MELFEKLFGNRKPPERTCTICHQRLKDEEDVLCAGCVCKLSKACTSDAYAVVFVVDASWGRYSKLLEVENGKLFYVEEIAHEIPGLSPHANTWNIEVRKKEELDFEKAYSYAKTAEEASVLDLVRKLIEENRRKTPAV